MSACRTEEVDFTPVWFMRQAGRFLPEYRDLRRAYSIIEIAKTPKLCEAVTVMPIKELGVDAAIIFADIMLPLEGMNVDFKIEENVGPIISNTINSVESAERLSSFEPKKHMPFLLEAIKNVQARLRESRTPLIGFAGAPFTIASYLIEGQPTRDFTKTKMLMFNDHEAWVVLMSKLADMTSSYLCAQIEAGVDAIQLFDSWAGALSSQDYVEYVAPFVRSIFDRVQKEYSQVPKIHFVTNSSHLLKAMKDRAGGDVFGIDWRLEIREARQTLGDKSAVQGNLEPAVLLSKDKPGFIAKRVQKVLDDNGGSTGHIFNLGHGVLKDTPVENARFVVDYVHEHSAKM